MFVEYKLLINIIIRHVSKASVVLLYLYQSRIEIFFLKGSVTFYFVGNTWADRNIDTWYRFSSICQYTLAHRFFKTVYRVYRKYDLYRIPENTVNTGYTYFIAKSTVIIESKDTFLSFESSNK